MIKVFQNSTLYILVAVFIMIHISCTPPKSLYKMEGSPSLISKINKALRKIEDGTYGYCEETNQPISLKRLIARPIATLSLEAQESHEKSEKIYKEKEY